MQVSVDRKRVDVYRESCRRFNSFLRRVLSTRVIILPKKLKLNEKEAFQGVFHKVYGKENIHLKDHHYSAMAGVALTHIYKDLMGEKSMPNTFLQELLNRYN